MQLIVLSERRPPAREGSLFGQLQASGRGEGGGLVYASNFRGLNDRKGGEEKKGGNGRKNEGKKGDDRRKELEWYVVAELIR